MAVPYPPEFKNAGHLCVAVDMAAPLSTFAEDVRGGAIAFCGHFLPEEQPEAVARELAAFFQSRLRT
jgi:pimeloyl-ACP methyl ester carboxylesterase